MKRVYILIVRSECDVELSDKIELTLSFWCSACRR